MKEPSTDEKTMYVSSAFMDALERRVNPRLYNRTPSIFGNQFRYGTPPRQHKPRLPQPQLNVSERAIKFVTEVRRRINRPMPEAVRDFAFKHFAAGSSAHVTVRQINRAWREEMEAPQSMTGLQAAA